MKMSFQEFVEINPRLTLTKGDTYSFIPMENLSPGNKYPSSINSKIYSGGGAKFQNKDVIFARITPCLENGKIAKVKDLQGNAGFGSTEYFVFRSREGISDSDYIYYLSLTDIIKKTAEKSMTGASGRQRADINSIKNLEFDFPPLISQRKIASILSAYDDLIENNTRRIKILEEMVQSIYKEWFVNFRFPGYEKVKFVDSPLGEIPEGWEVVEVSSLVNRYKAGSKYTKANVEEEGEVIVIDQSTDEYLGFHNNEPDHNATPKNPRIIFGDHTCKMQLLVRPFSVGPNVIPFDYVGNRPVQYLFYLIHSLVETREYKRHWNVLIANRVNVASEELQKNFADLITPFWESIETLKNKIRILRKTRDLLLPKLMNGEIEV